MADGHYRDVSNEDDKFREQQQNPSQSAAPSYKI